MPYRLTSLCLLTLFKGTSAASSFFDPIRTNISKIGEEFVDSVSVLLEIHAPSESGN